MTEYLPYLTREGDRWDLIAYRVYGDVAKQDLIIAANPEQVEKAKANPKLAGWFTGQVIKASGGKANPATVNALVAAKLGL